MLTRKWLLPLILLITLWLPFTVHAQNPISLNSMRIQIWPEYDKPSVLVIYQISLSSTTSFPATISLHIPAAAGEPNAVAERQLNGSLYTISYTRQVEGEWAVITFTTTSSEIQLEYYDPSLTINGNARHYVYTWPGDYGIVQLTIQVQQPVGATDMRISPNLGAGVTGSDNLVYYTQEIGAISAGQTFQITIDYQKTSNTLSVETLPVQPSAPISQSTVVGLNIFSWLPWIFGLLGAGLIIGGIVWYWQSGRQKPVKKAPQPRLRAEANNPEIDAASEEDAVYCAQCGRRASPGDQYCRSCGTQIRKR